MAPRLRLRLRLLLLAACAVGAAAAGAEDVEAMRRARREFFAAEGKAADLRCVQGDAASCDAVLEQMHFGVEEMWSHCADPIPLTKMERRRQRLRDSSTQQALTRLRECGFVRISKAVQPAAAQELLASIYGYVGEQPDALYSLRNAVGGGSRVEVMLPFAAPFNVSALHEAPLFFPVVRPAPARAALRRLGTLRAHGRLPFLLAVRMGCAGEEADGRPSGGDRGRDVPDHQDHRARPAAALRRAALARALRGGHRAGG